MQTRQVVGTLKKPDGTALAGVSVAFLLAPGSYTPEDQVPQGAIVATTDATGAFSATLWTNEVGETESIYTCKLPVGSFRFTLPSGTTPIELSLLRQAGITPNDPQYDTLLTWLVERWKGAWSALTAYSRGDQVIHDGRTWIATADTTAGDEPGVDAVWDLHTDRGEQGEQGEQGETGETGPVGPPGPAGIAIFPIHPFIFVRV